MVDKQRKNIKLPKEDHDILKVISAKADLSHSVLLSFAVRMLASQFPELYSDFPPDYIEHPKYYGDKNGP